MKRRTKQALSLVGAAAVVTLAWPGPSSADTTLGGYSGVAQAQAIRVQIYDPVIPIPATPQVDGGIAYTKATTDTGPVSRATASYLWPGDVVGDGFGQLVGNEKATYPVQVNSKYPATQSAPDHNTAQLTKGNGMTTSTDGFTTKAYVAGLGVAGPNTDLLSGIGDGLQSLLGQTPSPSKLPDAPVPVGDLLAGLATVENVKSSSSVEVAAKTVTSSAQSSMSEISLLGGLITIDGLKSTSKTVSNGTKATTAGTITAGTIKIAGIDLGITSDGLVVAGSATKLPDVPDTVTSTLEKLGISFHFAPSTRSIDGANGSLTSTALEVSIDTQPLKTALNIGGLVRPLQDLLEQIPKLGDQISPLLSLGPKIVFRVADVSSSATAAPAYTGPAYPPVTSNPGTGNNNNPGTSNNNPGDNGVPLNPGSPGLPGSTTPPDTTTPPAVQPSGFALPGLGTIPRLVVLGALAAAVAFGWLFRAVGTFILGGGGRCAFGLSTGVPDLRKG